MAQEAFGEFSICSNTDWMKKCKKQAPRAPGVFSIDFNEELAQGLPGACSIDLKEDSIMELEGTFSRGSRSIFDRLLVRILFRRLKELAKGVASALPIDV